MTDHMDTGVQLVLAIMRSASTDRISPMKWWERAKTALETGAAVACDFPEMVSVMGRKLEIEVTCDATAAEIARISAALDGQFEEFRRTMEEQALYVVAMAQAARREEREAKKQGSLLA